MSEIETTFVVAWNEDGKACEASFSDYEDALKYYVALLGAPVREIHGDAGRLISYLRLLRVEDVTLEANAQIGSTREAREEWRARHGD